MPRRGPAKSGYARLAQAEEDDEQYLDDSEDELQQPRNLRSASDSNWSSTQPGPVPGMSAGGSRRKNPLERRRRASSGVDIKAINARLEKWADEIASKLKIKRVKGKTRGEEKLEIHHSVFQAPDWIRPATEMILNAQLQENAHRRMNRMEFDDIVQSVRDAIELGEHPKMITQGSSGSYFAKNKEGKVVGVFKPKDEEPYASRNPKWTKWIHRNLFPFFFGRACLIPNLCYVSEAAAFVLDQRLQTYIVPYTDVIYLSSISFNYEFWDRRQYYRKKKPLPQKPGSFQVFLKGYRDANLFLKEHPWPDQQSSNLNAPSFDKRKKRRRWTDDCRPGAGTLEDDDNEQSRDDLAEQRKEFWTEGIQQAFREELEKLVILDYIMRNTDRGLDNWMIKIDQENETATLVADFPTKENRASTDAANGQKEPYAREPQMTTIDESKDTASILNPDVLVGAIDNSLSWPWKHPDAWRSFPFGWLFLPVSLIGQAFSERTRQHFLPLLTSKQWWSDTQVALRECFSQDSDFKERMFARQMAVMKGQAWNVVETLKTADHGPLELTRRTRVCVWDDLVDVPIVVPMRVPSFEIRRKQRASARKSDDQEEADLGAARSSREMQDEALLAASPPADIPSPNRFNLSRSGSMDGTQAKASSDASNINARIAPWDPQLEAGYGDADSPSAARNALERSHTRLSADDGRRLQSLASKKKRNFSFSARRVSDYEQGGDMDGDLGFAAARGMEGNRKKVIVERLETVKSKRPVFTWC